MKSNIKKKLWLSIVGIALITNLQAQELPVEFLQLLDTAEVSICIDSTEYTKQEFIRYYYQNKDSTEFRIWDREWDMIYIYIRKKFLNKFTK